MPTLDFKGKQFVHAHHLGVPFRELKLIPAKSLPAPGNTPSLEDNLIIHDDNLQALKALLPTHAGKIDCIFLDPPYNTGNEGWCYNDNLRSPLMQEWIKKAANPVDKEDLERHDKWLCMMWPRLQLLKELLAEWGAIFITIDDNEVHALRCLCDEIFGGQNFVTSITTRANPRGRQSDVHFATTHEYCLVYASNHDFLELNGISLSDEKLDTYDREDPNGEKWRELGLRQRGADSLRTDREDMHFPIYVCVQDGSVALAPSEKYTEKVIPKKSDGRDGRWMWSPQKVEQELPRVYGREVKQRDGTKRWDVFIKDYLNREDEQRREKPSTLWLEPTMNTELGGKLLAEIIGRKAFNYPKPLGLLSKIVEIGTHRNSIVLDSFAGSGTTAHAVLRANKKDGGNRKFILIECEQYCDTLTAERTRRVITGYSYKGTLSKELFSKKISWSDFAKHQHKVLDQVQAIENLAAPDYDRIKKEIRDGSLVVTGERDIMEMMPGLGGSFSYCELGEAIQIDNLLNGEAMPSFDSLARYVFYTVTGQALDKVAAPSASGFIGETAVFRVHLLYQPNREWLRGNAAALDAERVEAIRKANTGKRCIVFAVAKFMSQKALTAKRIEFCQLPYAVHRMLGD